MTNDYHILESTPTPVISVTPNNNIMFYARETELLRISDSGFYVRGVKVEADKDEAQKVYKAFKAFLVWHGLTKD